jgi:hypothetical protein
MFVHLRTGLSHCLCARGGSKAAQWWAGPGAQFD